MKFTNYLKNHTFIQNSEEKSTIFPLHYTEKEKKCLSSLTILNKNRYQYYGTIEQMSSLYDFLNSAVSGQIKTLEKIIIMIIKNINKLFNTSHFWIKIIITLNTKSSWIKPRWHKDGKFFDRSTPNHQIKFVTSLLGANTLLAANTQQNYTKFDNLIQKKRDENDIYQKNKKLDPHSQTAMDYFFNVLNPKYENLLVNMITASETNKSDIGILFAVGAPNAAIHSEPLMDRPRIFLSIVPGTKSEILQLKKKVTK